MNKGDIKTIFLGVILMLIFFDGNKSYGQESDQSENIETEKVSYLKAYINSGPMNNYDIRDLRKFDNTYHWHFFRYSGLNSIGIGYQRKWKDKFSIQYDLAYSGSNIGFTARDSIQNIYKNHYTKYLNVGISFNYHLEETLRGLRFGIGPSVYYIVNHKARLESFLVRRDSESMIREELNDAPILLRLDATYSFKLIRLLGVMWDMEIGYTPTFAIIPFIKQNSLKSFFSRDLRLSVNLLLESRNKGKK